MMVRETLLLVAIGAALGTLASLAANRYIAGQLFGVTPRDPAAIGVALLVLGIVAMMTRYVPARQATRIDAGMALRAEWRVSKAGARRGPARCPRRQRHRGPVVRVVVVRVARRRVDACAGEGPILRVDPHPLSDPTARSRRADRRSGRAPPTPGRDARRRGTSRRAAARRRSSRLRGRCRTAARTPGRRRASSPARDGSSRESSRPARGCCRRGRAA